MSIGRLCSQINTSRPLSKGGELRRTIAIAVAIGTLVAAAAAYAALNTYTANFSFSGKAGSKSAPTSIGYTEKYSAANATSGFRAGVLTKIVTKVYGLQNNGKDFPTCSMATLSKAPKFYLNCPKGSLIASGRVHSLLGSPNLSTDPTNVDSGGHKGSAGAPCAPYLNVYNGGQNVHNYFFYVKTGTDCAGLKTGASAPWQGKIKQSGGYAVETVPLPADISTEAGNLVGVYGSLINETLTFAKVSKKVHGKTIGYNASVGCKSGKRPWSFSFTAIDGKGTTETKGVSGSTKC
jgi:hypothetical protein